MIKLFHDNIYLVFVVCVFSLPDHDVFAFIRLPVVGFAMQIHFCLTGAEISGKFDPKDGVSVGRKESGMCLMPFCSWL